MDPGSSPSRILNNHSEDQFPILPRCRSSSHLPPGLGDQPPVLAETGPAPPDYGLGCHHDQRVFPS